MRYNKDIGLEPDVRRILGLAGDPNQTDSGSLDLIGVNAKFSTRHCFCRDGDEADYVYRLVEGTAQGYVLTECGDRRVLSFYFPGDIFGIESTGRYSMYVDAITDGLVQTIRRRPLFNVIARDERLFAELWQAVMATATRDKRHVLRLSSNASARVASFILDVADRLGDQITLPMARADIANYLALTIETLSRQLTILKEAKVITVKTRMIRILNRGALKRYSGNTIDTRLIPAPSLKETSKSI